MLPVPHHSRPYTEAVYIAFLGARLALNGAREELVLLLRARAASAAWMLACLVMLTAFMPPSGHAPSTEAHMEAIATNTAQVRQATPPPTVIEIPPLPVPPTHTPWNQRGIFLTPSSIGSAEFRGKTIDRLRAVGGNAIIFDVKGSAVHFDAQDVPLAEELGLLKPWYNVEDVVRILHEHGLYAIARYIAVKDHSLTALLPETALHDPRTGQPIGSGWIDPAHPDALEYNRQIICDLARSGIDEINLDYIRYDTRVSERIEAAYSAEERIGKIETFLQMARDAINQCGPHAKLGVSTFAILGWDYENNVASIGQDVVRFAPLLDVISPMAYNIDFSVHAYHDPSGERERWNYLVYRTLTGYAEKLGHEHSWKLRPWLQGWGVDAREMSRQMEGVFDAGFCGFQVWHANNSYETAYRAMQDITVPEHCRFPVALKTE